MIFSIGGGDGEEEKKFIESRTTPATHPTDYFCGNRRNDYPGDGSKPVR
jgi:hypothetical protein